MKRLVLSILIGLASASAAWAEETAPSPDAAEGAEDQTRGESAPGDGVADSPSGSSLCDERDRLQAAAWSAAEPRCARVTGQVFAGYRDGSVGGERGSEFSIDRAELAGAASWRASERLRGGVRGRLQAIRSAGPQSLFGIDGDSIVMRVIEAYGQGGIRFDATYVRARLGLVPERWLELVEQGYELRALGPLASDQPFFERADLGATISALAWDGRLGVDISVVNGEGPAQREQNLGKNTTGIVTLRPIVRDALTWSAHVGYRDGSTGVASGRDHRLAFASTLRTPRATAGIEFVRAFGLEDQADRRAQVTSAWASARALPYAGLAGRVDRIDHDLDLADTSAYRITASVFGDLLAPGGEAEHRLRLYLAYQHERFGDSAGAVAGAPEALDVHRALVQLDARGAFYSSQRE